jgi:type I restriction enzyme S subunit
MIRIRVNRRLLSPEFLRQIWNAKQTRDQIEAAAHTTAGIWKISQGDIEAFTLPVPSLAEQQEIIRRVEMLFKIADRVEKRYEEGRRRVDSLTQVILAKAFRGALVPQDPKDEPADVLLDRLRPKARARGGNKHSQI